MSVKLFYKAKADLRGAKSALSSGDEYDLQLSAYLVQQCIEKTIKFILSEYGIVYPRSHDMVLLQGMIPAMQDIIDLKVLSDLYHHGPVLTEWATKTRYDESYLVARRFVLDGMQLAEALIKNVETYLSGVGLQDGTKPNYPNLKDMNLEQ